MKYQPKHLQQLFNKSPETIRQWSLDFAGFLSVDANPDTGHRRYTDDDLRVFSYVNVRKGEGATPEQINAELAQGQRLEPPQEPSAIVAADERSETILLSIRLEQAQGVISDLQQQLQDTRTERDKALGALENADKLRHEQIDDLRQQLTQANEEIRKLYRELARLEVGQGETDN